MSYYLPDLADMRSNQLSWHLLNWELAAIFAPDEIKVDIFDLLCCRGGAILQNFITPDGKVMRKKRINGDFNAGEFKSSFKDYYKQSCRLESRFKDFYRMNKFECRKKTADLGKTKFIEVWNSVVPEAYKDDLVRAERVGTLVKFNLLTYQVKAMRNPL